MHFFKIPVWIIRIDNRNNKARLPLSLNYIFKAKFI